MAKVTIKRKHSGGLRTPRRLVWGTQRLIKAIWESHGGIHELARKFDVLPQSLINWRNMGKVPLVQAGRFARLLDLPVEALNYKDYGIFTGGNAKWEEVLESCRLENLAVVRIMAGKSPSPYKE